jgi:hypothetical protein
MNIISGVAGHGDTSFLDRMLVLPMAAASTDMSPTVILDQSN